MAGAESRPSQPNPLQVEMAEASGEERVREDNFDLLRTHIPGLWLLVDHEAEPDLTRSATRTLSEQNDEYAERSRTIKELLQLQQPLHDQLEKLPVEYPGVRGARNIITGNETQINPHTNDIFDEELFKASLGERSGEVSHRKVAVSIELDPDKEDAEGFLVSLRRRLRRQGFSGDEIKKRLKIQKGFRVDEKALRKMIEKGEVTLLPGTWNIGISDWKVVPRRVTTLREMLEAEERERTSVDSNGRQKI